MIFANHDNISVNFIISKKIYFCFNTRLKNINYKKKKKNISKKKNIIILIKNMKKMKMIIDF
jgi:hypothetical protein